MSVLSHPAVPVVSAAVVAAGVLGVHALSGGGLQASARGGGLQVPPPASGTAQPAPALTFAVPTPAAPVLPLMPHVPALSGLLERIDHDTGVVGRGQIHLVGDIEQALRRRIEQLLIAGGKQH
jgi:hypothetical protein